MIADLADAYMWTSAIVVLYFVPTILAFGRKVPSPWSVAAINVFLGWTLIGWVVALALGLRDPKPTSPASAGEPSDS